MDAGKVRVAPNEVRTVEGPECGGGSVIGEVPCRRSERYHGITSLRIEARMNGKRSGNKLLESALQELCAVESTADDPIVDCGQCLSHRFGILYIGSKFRVSHVEFRSPGSDDAQQL